MGNWNFVFPYSRQSAEWLEKQGMPHLPVEPGNRLPTTSQVVAALEAIGADKNPPSILVDDFDWDDDGFVPENAFKMKGDRLTQFRLLVELSSTCGQLWFYPDTGECPVVFSCGMAPDSTNRIYQAAEESDDSWQFFHERMYGNSA